MRPGLLCSVAACGLLAAADAPALELEPGDLVAVDARAHSVLRIDPSSGARQEIATVPGGLVAAVDPQGQLLVASDYARVVRVDPGTGASTVVSQGGLLAPQPFAIALDAEGGIVVTRGTIVGSLVHIDSATGEQTLLSEGGHLQCPTGLSLLPDGNLLVVDGGRGGAGPGTILRVDAQTGAQQVVAGPTLHVPWAGVATPEGEAFYTTLMPGHLVGVDLATGLQELLADTGDSFALAREAAGTLVVASSHLERYPEDGVIRRIDPVTGAGYVLTTFDGFVTSLAVVPDPLARLPASEGPDPDHDGLADPEDNCLGRWNPTQSDADQDGFGNLCDGDFDGDGRVGARDLTTLGRTFGARTGDPDYDRAVDLDDDGAVGATDLLLWMRSFARAPGPSGLACAGSRPCP